MLKKIELGAWITAALLFGLLTLGFAVPSLRKTTSWAMMPAGAAALGAFVLSKVNRMRALAAQGRAEQAAFGPRG